MSTRCGQCQEPLPVSPRSTGISPRTLPMAVRHLLHHRRQVVVPKRIPWPRLWLHMLRNRRQIRLGRSIGLGIRRVLRCSLGR